MSTKLAAGLAVVLFSTCGDEAPQSAPAPDFTCDHAYDAGCRYEAEVQIDAGRLVDASMFDTAQGWGTMGAFRNLQGQVTVRDRLGTATTTCHFTASYDVGTEMVGSNAIVTSAPTVVFEGACPIACADWLFPASGTFDDTEGRYTIQPDESAWSLQLGAWAPEEPYSQEWLVTGPSSSSYGANAVLNEPVVLLPSGWTVPSDAPPHLALDAVCR